MNKTIYIRVTVIASAVIVLLCSNFAFALTDARDVKDIGIDEKLGAIIPPDIELVNESGDTLKVIELLSEDVPTVLNLVYYSCPRVCNFATDGLLQVIGEVGYLKLGDDYKVLTVSFDPEETPEIAESKALRYREAVKNAEPDPSDWQFLTGDSENIKRLTDSVGFRYIKDGDEFAHGSALIFLTPEGKVTRYLHGIQHEPADFRLSLLEASRGEIGSSKIMNAVLLFCYGFDPIGKRYALKALNIVKASGVVTLLLLCGVLTYFWRRER
jgi:protein SCO1